MTNEQKSFFKTNAPAKSSVAMLVHHVYSYVAEVYTTPELEQKRRAMHAIVDEVCDEINRTHPMLSEEEAWAIVRRSQGLEEE